MHLLIQRVKQAKVWVEGQDEDKACRIERGLLIFIGLEKGDGLSQVKAAVQKLLGLRVFEDKAKKINLSAESIKGSYLVISQFTLCANFKKGKRPSFEQAMPPENACKLYESFCHLLQKESGCDVQQGFFGEHMEVKLLNDGPFTFALHFGP